FRHACGGGCSRSGVREGLRRARRSGAAWTGPCRAWPEDPADSRPLRPDGQPVRLAGVLSKRPGRGGLADLRTRSVLLTAGEPGATPGKNFLEPLLRLPSRGEAHNGETPAWLPLLPRNSHAGCRCAGCWRPPLRSPTSARATWGAASSPASSI